MKRVAMSKQTRGFCKYCGKDYTRSGMIKHLAACKEKDKIYRDAKEKNTLISIVDIWVEPAKSMNCKLKNVFDTGMERDIVIMKDDSGWKNVTDAFTEQQRHYRGTYMEIDEIYDEIEVSLFSALDELYEIYVSYGIMYGIIRVKSDEAWSLREEIKEVLEKDYKENQKPSGEFINSFAEKYHLELEI